MCFVSFPFFLYPDVFCGRWDRPNEEVAAALEARIQQANAQVDDALQVSFVHCAPPA